MVPSTFGFFHLGLFYVVESDSRECKFIWIHDYVVILDTFSFLFADCGHVKFYNYWGYIIS